MEHAETKYSRIIDEIKQYREKKDHLNRYFANCVFIALGQEDLAVNYKSISHNNIIMTHGFARILDKTCYIYEDNLENKLN